MTADAQLAASMLDMGRSARDAARTLAAVNPQVRDDALQYVAEAIKEDGSDIVSTNKEDVSAAKSKGLSSAMIDRLTLDADRLSSVVASVEAISRQADPVGRSLHQWTQPNGLRFDRVSVPIGVIGMIYESRPNVTADAAALCIRSGNAVILRGGSEAVQTNRALYAAIRKGLARSDVPASAVQLVATQERAAVGALLRGLDGTVDLIIPRGGKGLIERVQTDARVPVLAHLDGLNHTYIHRSADIDMALNIVENAKMRRTGVCGATETVLVDRSVAVAIIPSLVNRLSALDCEIRGDEASRALHPAVVPASEDDFATEHLAPILNLAVVDDLQQALDHISTYGSGHTDAIVAEEQTAAEVFLRRVDSAIVLHNASTQFADGGEFGFGAEIGIATGRLHARGPVGADQLTTFKYQVTGSGTLRA
ncbi:MAG: glutamate-5-semialdehyde dehydrogenase [Litorimonas sp.]